MTAFTSTTVLKRDLFSETHKGHMADMPGRPVIRRIVTATPWWSRPIAWALARREIAALRAVKGIEGTPQLLFVDRDGLCRTWSEGAPLHLARPGDAGWYRDAFRLLRDMRRAGLTHNDLAKPQNWLMTPDGRAAVIDFQLARLHRRRGALFRLMAYEDFRHLIKQMRAFAPERMTPTGKRILSRRSWPSRLWMATGKKVYNFITRGLFRWSDGEGTHDRLDNEGPAIRNALMARPGVRDVAISTYPLPRKGVGLYAFVEAEPDASRAITEMRDPPGAARADLVQIVPSLPRGPDGRSRDDILNLIAMNRAAEIEALVGDDAELASIVAPIVAGRRNMTDRRISRFEQSNARGQ